MKKLLIILTTLFSGIIQGMGTESKMAHESIQANDNLIGSIEADYLDGVKEAIRAGAEVDSNKNYLHLYPLINALSMSENPNGRKIVEYLIDHDANLNLQYSNASGYFRTPLFFAINLNKDWLVDLLIRKKVDLNQKVEEEDKTAIFYAVSRKNKNAIKKLIKSGADLTIRNNLGETVFDYAKREEPDMLSVLDAAQGPHLD